MAIVKKIKAFTLSEMLVVLVVSSIVITATFSVLTMVQKQFMIVQKNIYNKQEINFFERLLWRDFNTYTISYQKKKDLLVLTNDINSIQYSFFKGYTIREKDTFLVQITSKELFLDGNKVVDGVIDAIKIKTTPLFGSKKIFIHSSKDATYYLNK